MGCHYMPRVPGPPKCPITGNDIDYDKSSWSLAKQALENERRKHREPNPPTLGSAYTITPAEKAKRDAERAEEILRVRQSHDEWLNKDGKVESNNDIPLLFNLLLKTLLWTAVGIVALFLFLSFYGG